MASASRPKIRVGIVGVGAAGRAFIPPLRSSPHFELAAIAEPTQSTRESVAAENNIPGYSDLGAMLQGSDLDAIYIATPTDMHRAHANEAFAARKHVLTEKPMAIHLNDAKEMVERGRDAGVALVVGHAHGFDLPIQRMLDIIQSGRLGRVRMINTWNFTDWVYRPRRPEELETDKGGGITFRQGSHQFDIIRMLGGGLVESVRASTFDWDPNRSAIGAHTVFLRFSNGVTATAVYNGYGYFSAMELCGDVTEWGFLEPIENRTPVTRPESGATIHDELLAKQKRAKNAIPSEAPYQPTFGLTVVSCEKGDIRQSPKGLYVYTAQGREEIVLPTDKSPRDLVLEEFYGAITGLKQPIHDGRWGLANLEICAAAIESSQGNREVELTYQVGLPRSTP